MTRWSAYILLVCVAANAVGDVSKVKVTEVARSSKGDQAPAVDAGLARFLHVAERWRLVMLDVPSPPRIGVVLGRSGVEANVTEGPRRAEHVKLPGGSTLTIQLFDDVEIELEYL